jgi:ABC-type multidrug transport system permease subunit
MSSMIVDLPYKITNSIVVNTTLYFMANLRREPGPFFYFLLVGFTTGMSMSMFFRLFASMTKTLAQALAPSSIVLMLLVIYTGFAIPIQCMFRIWLAINTLLMCARYERLGGLVPLHQPSCIRIRERYGQ